MPRDGSGKPSLSWAFGVTWHSYKVPHLARRLSVSYDLRLSLSLSLSLSLLPRQEAAREATLCATKATIGSAWAAIHHLCDQNKVLIFRRILLSVSR